MRGLYELLEERLYGIKRLVILGVGSLLNSDDGVGIVIVENLKKRIEKFKFSAVRVIAGENAPENYTGEIKRVNPDHILVIDAVDINKEPGNVEVLRLDDIEGVTFSTHMLPIKIMLDYLIKEIGCDITIIGIQPKNLVFAEEMTQEVADSVNNISSIIEKVVIELETVK